MRHTIETTGTPSADERHCFARRLLSWYDRHHRDLPWRIAPAHAARGEKPDPYRVWLSEVMLQQTTVQAVKPYFAAFTARWPTVTALAGAETDDIMKAWAGLGYYSRARNLKACADMVAAHHGGKFPDTAAGLRALPGIGDILPPGMVSPGAQALIQQWLPSSLTGYRDAFVFVALILMLLFRPNGILGRPDREEMR